MDADPPAQGVNIACRSTAYRQETDKKRLLIRKADTTRGRLVFVTEALRKLLADEYFVTLLRAEGLDTLPRPLADRFQASSQS